MTSSRRRAMDHQVGGQTALGFHIWRFLSLSQSTRAPQRGSAWLQTFFFGGSTAERWSFSHIHGGRQRTERGMQGGRDMTGLPRTGAFRLHSWPHHSTVPETVSPGASTLTGRNEGSTWMETSAQAQLQQQRLRHWLYKAPLMLAICSGSCIRITE